MKKVAIISPTGMLGSMVYKVLKDKYKLTLLYRDEKKLQLLDKEYGGVKKHKKIQFSLDSVYADYYNSFPKDSISPYFKTLFKKIGEVDAVINCAGVIKPYANSHPEITFFVNGAFPHILSSLYKDKLIQITTDCVFSGVDKHRPYKEDHIHSPNDIYGLSKSIGEPSSTSLVLRTSIIGPELSGKVSLLEWFRSQKDEVKGFTNHLWNGVTTQEFGNICDKIISKRNSFPKSGLFHIFSNDISKYELLRLMKKKFQSSVTIKKATSIPIDRRLSSNFTLVKKLHIPSIEKMIFSL